MEIRGKDLKTYADAGGAPIKEGVLTKKKVDENVWKPRWVVIRPGSLAYYRSTADQVPIKLLPLPGPYPARRLSPAEAGLKEHCFEIRTHDFTHKFQAPSARELSLWLQAIEEGSKAHSSHLHTSIQRPSPHRHRRHEDKDEKKEERKEREREREKTPSPVPSHSSAAAAALSRSRSPPPPAPSAEEAERIQALMRKLGEGLPELSSSGSKVSRGLSTSASSSNKDRKGSDNSSGSLAVGVRPKSDSDEPPAASTHVQRKASEGSRTEDASWQGILTMEDPDEMLAALKKYAETHDLTKLDARGWYRED